MSAVTEIARLPIHFDVPADYLSAADYLVAVKSLQTTLDVFNRRIFNGEIQFQFVVAPPEDGSFKGVCGIIAVGYTILTASIYLSETATFRGFVKGLTGYEVQHYEAAESVGKFLRDMATGFFLTESDELERTIPKDWNLDKALRAKTKFYTMCLQNDEIAAVGFDDGDNFPIKKQDFAKHLSKEKARLLPSEFKLDRDAIVVSPVDIDADNQWKLQDRTTGATIRAYMRDEVFRQGFLKGGKYPLKRSGQDDQMTVMVEYKRQEKNGDIKLIETSINTVHTFNGTELVPVPDRFQTTDTLIEKEEVPMERIWSTNE